MQTPDEARSDETRSDEARSDDTRRRFLAYFSGIGLGGTLLPGVLWAQIQTQTQAQPQNSVPVITDAMLVTSLTLAGLSFSPEDRRSMVQAANQNLQRYADLRKVHIPNNVSPPFYFSPLTPGMTVDRARYPLHFTTPKVHRPSNLEDVAFWPITELSQLIRTRQVTSVELTNMYLARLHRYNEKLNCVVTFLDDVAMQQAKQADSEIAAGKYKGPLHGIPWGAKDIINVKGYRVTWGSGAFKDQMLDEEASVVEMLRDAGAVLIAKLASGELAGGDHWWGGQTKNPWNLSEGSGGSSAGPGSATAAGCVAFGIGTETGGSILHPAARCGATGLRPTFGRVSRYGVMALSWTQDRLGPLCRYSEDCALVMSVIARPDGRDLSVSELPFNYNANFDIKKLRVGYLKEGFDETSDPVLRKNEQLTLQQVEALGVKLVPVKVPDDVDAPGLGVEAAVFFDEMIRTGRDKQMTDPIRANGYRASRLVPAVEYLQSQRTRSMMMAKLAEATAEVDVYLAPPTPSIDTAVRNRGGVTNDGAPVGAGGTARRNQNLRHFNMANVAGYPAVSVPNGFQESGSPTAMIFYGRPFTEMGLLALTKAWQDASGVHLKHPNLDALTLPQRSALQASR